jgi:hypothetical protein
MKIQYISFDFNDNKQNFTNLDRFDLMKIKPVTFQYKYKEFDSNQLIRILSHLKAINIAIESKKDYVIIGDTIFEDLTIPDDISRFDFIIIKGKINRLNGIISNIERLNCYLIRSHYYQTFRNHLIKTYKKLINTKNILKYGFESSLHKLYKCDFWI